MSVDFPEYLDKVLDVLNEAVFVYNQNMEIIHFNKQAEAVTGHRRNEVLGKKCVLIFNNNLCLNNCELCMTVKRGENRETRFESAFLRKDGAHRIGQFRVGVLQRKSDRQVRVLVSLADITEITQLRKKLRETHSFRNLVGKSRVMKDLFQTIQNVAAYDSTVFIHGESGTGKELVARAIHYESPRADKSLVKVNCSAFSDSLLESELFGHVKGAFTGAIRDRVGRFEEANGGTLFLDEVGDMNPAIQVKLLRAIQEKEVERVGENITRKVDIRIIAATNKDLQKRVEEGLFREDLYYRLNVIPLNLPPLRDRREDIHALAHHFLKQWNARHSKKVLHITSDALGRLMDHSWPGNVRELENAVEHACVKCKGDTLEVADLPAYLFAGPAPRPKRRRKWLTRPLVADALRKCNRNQTQAARMLGVHRITLWRKMKEFDITP